MGQSRVSAANDQGIGTKPADLGAWDKLQLGWLDYEVVPAGPEPHARPGPQRVQLSSEAQGVVVPLGKKEVLTAVRGARRGRKQWWSGTGNDLDDSMARQVTVPAGSLAR